ncbi:MAG: condensation domain-containing protein [Candidatus Bathyarchaeota archaeon]|nr:condensation domain-containing protein [Candidatus Bathyarchaeota archaeon]
MLVEKAPESSQSFQRELAIERLLYRYPLNVIKMIIRLESSVNRNMLKRAVEKVCRKHPFLRSRIVLRDDGTAYFTTDGAQEMRLKVRQKTSDDDYIEVIEEEDQIPFEMDKGPLARIILLESETRPDIVVYAHHVICDGLSLMYMIRHLMEFLASPDKNIEVIEPISYSKQLLEAYPPSFLRRFMMKRINSKWAKRKVIFGEDDLLKLHEKVHPDKHVHVGFSMQDTTALRDRCRAEGVTINSAIITAILTAKRQIPELVERRDEIGFAVNTRDRLEVDPGEACGFYATGVILKQKFEESKSFWDNARAVHQHSQQTLQDDKALFERRTMILTLDPTLIDGLLFSVLGDFEDPLIKKFEKAYAKGTSVGAVLTNLGGAHIPKQYGPYMLDTVIFLPPGSVGGVLAMGASGIVGKLEITIPYREHLLSTELINRFTKAFITTLNNALVPCQFTSTDRFGSPS